MLKVILHLMTEDKMEVTVQSNDHIRKLKDHISHKHGFSPQSLKLKAYGKPLLDDQTFAQSNIKDGDIITVIIKPDPETVFDKFSEEYINGYIDRVLYPQKTTYGLNLKTKCKKRGCPFFEK